MYSLGRFVFSEFYMIILNECIYMGSMGQPSVWLISWSDDSYSTSTIKYLKFGTH